jgi:hypothetical protein
MCSPRCSFEFQVSEFRVFTIGIIRLLAPRMMVYGLFGGPRSWNNPEF